MKKYLFISLIAIVLTGFSSCVVESKDPCKFHSKSITLTVRQSEWKYDQQSMQFYAHFNVPELTNDVYLNGNYSMYRIYNYARDDEYQVALPQSVYMIESTNGGTGEYYYTQSVDYRVGMGYVEVQVTNSDYFYSEDSQGYLINPETMDFHLQLIW